MPQMANFWAFVPYFAQKNAKKARISAGFSVFFVFVSYFFFK